MANQPLISRRQFLSVLAVATAAYPLSGLAINSKKISLVKMHKEPWLTLSSVQEHLFPKGTSIGEKDIHALEYLQVTMKTPDFDGVEKKLLHNGVSWLNDLSEKQYAKKFNQLDHDSKEKILRRIENSSAGERWLSTLLTYLVEALLTDPIYGGNPKGIGWQWLEHIPGFPRPPENKKYFKLDIKRFRQTKS